MGTDILARAKPNIALFGVLFNVFSQSLERFFDGFLVIALDISREWFKPWHNRAGQGDFGCAIAAGTEAESRCTHTQTNPQYVSNDRKTVHERTASVLEMMMPGEYFYRQRISFMHT